MKKMENSGICNFRDLGNTINEDGKRVKEGFFFRSAPITFSNDEQRRKFKELHIRNILDLRSSEEVDACPDEVFDDMHYYQISALPNDINFDMSSQVLKMDLDFLKNQFQKMYEILPFNNPAYHKMFELMLAHESFVFHCSAGKDRTGVAAYLILKTLHVSDEVIMEDYMASNIYRNEMNQRLMKHVGNEAIKELIYVKENYLRAAMKAVSLKYASFDEFLEKEYGIDEEKRMKLREYYLND